MLEARPSALTVHWPVLGALASPNCLASPNHASNLAAEMGRESPDVLRCKHLCPGGGGGQRGGGGGPRRGQPEGRPGASPVSRGTGDKLVGSAVLSPPGLGNLGGLSCPLLGRCMCVVWAVCTLSEAAEVDRLKTALELASGHCWASPRGSISRGRRAPASPCVPSLLLSFS